MYGTSLNLSADSTYTLVKLLEEEKEMNMQYGKACFD
jgi:predicted Kef-type K+ transport protein